MPTGLRWERSDSGRCFRRYERSTGETVAVHAPISLYEDFLGKMDSDLIVPHPWNLCLAGDQQCAGAFVASGAGGAFRLTSGNNGGTYTDDGSMLNLALNFTPGSLYDLNFEAKIKMNTSVATGTMGFGFTDTDSETDNSPVIEEPSSISATTLTTTATDGFGLIYDTSATNDYWHSWGVATNVDTVFENSAVAPVAGTYNILRAQIANDLSGKLWIDGVLVKSLAACVANVPLTPYVYVNATTNASVVIEVDYVRLWASR